MQYPSYSNYHLKLLFSRILKCGLPFLTELSRNLPRFPFIDNKKLFKCLISPLILKICRPHFEELRRHTIFLLYAFMSFYQVSENKKIFKSALNSHVYWDTLYHIYGYNENLHLRGKDDKKTVDWLSSSFIILFMKYPVYSAKELYYNGFYQNLSKCYKISQKIRFLEEIHFCDISSSFILG